MEPQGHRVNVVNMKSKLIKYFHIIFNIKNVIFGLLIIFAVSCYHNRSPQVISFYDNNFTIPKTIDYLFEYELEHYDDAILVVDHAVMEGIVQMAYLGLRSNRIKNITLEKNKIIIIFCIDFNQSQIDFDIARHCIASDPKHSARDIKIREALKNLNKIISNSKPIPPHMKETSDVPDVSKD